VLLGETADGEPRLGIMRPGDRRATAYRDRAEALRVHRQLVASGTPSEEAAP
jgi:hypothetical protein